MIIKYGEPWLIWSDKLSFGLNKGDISETFEGGTDFTLAMKIKMLTKSNNKRTLFSKLPNYCGIDLEPDNRLLLILKIIQDDKEVYRTAISDEKINDDYNFIIFRYCKNNKIVDVSINEKIVISYTLTDNEKFSSEEEPHIIFSSGNFPHNNFNLNYCSYDIDYLLISKSYKCYNELTKIDDSVIALFDFNDHTEYNVYDLTGNCNFLHKII